MVALASSAPAASPEKPLETTNSTSNPAVVLVECDISRWKRVIGDGLRSHTTGRQATEVAIAANVLDRMLELGRPNYVRIA